MNIIKLTYRQSCYFSVLHHYFTIKKDRSVIQNIHFKNFVDKYNAYTIKNSENNKWRLHHKFIEKYIEDIHDKDMIEIILVDDTVDDSLKVYLKMKFNI